MTLTVENLARLRETLGSLARAAELLQSESREPGPGTAVHDKALNEVHQARAAVEVVLHGAVIDAWIAVVGPYWVLPRLVPWRALIPAMTTEAGGAATRRRLQLFLAEVFGPAAPAIQIQPGQAAGYPAGVLWAAINRWHLDHGLPLPEAQWRIYQDVAQTLDVLPLLVEVLDDAPGGTPSLKQVRDGVRRRGGSIPKLQIRVTFSLARDHHAVVREWVARTRATPPLLPQG